MNRTLLLVGIVVTLLGATPPSLAAGRCPAGRIAFVRESVSRGGIYSVCPDGSGLVRLTSGQADFRPAWSPSGERIVFQRHSDISASPRDPLPKVDGEVLGRRLEPIGCQSRPRRRGDRFDLTDFAHQ